MKLVMTLMVRDEADIVGAMLEHHLRQGIDHFIATDNGSVDGTREILARYADMGVLTLHDDARHQKQQSEVVTGMAREAATRFHADWVLNADADEFWVAENPDQTLREAIERIPTSYRAFPVPVIDMIGDPALEGSGLSRLVYRDTRSTEDLNRVGIFAHSTHDVLHVGDPEVTVAQGNHFVNIESEGSPEPGTGIEVLHLQWRSWQQIKNKVENAGKAYELSGLMPSPNHHGMKDYRRLREGTLFTHYLGRHPRDAERTGNPDFVRDDRLAHTLQNPRTDVAVHDDEWRIHGSLAQALVALESRLKEMEIDRDTHRQQLSEALLSADEWHNRAIELGSQISAQRIAHERTTAELDTLRKSRVLRLQRKIFNVFKRKSASLS